MLILLTLLAYYVSSVKGEVCSFVQLDLVGQGNPVIRQAQAMFSKIMFGLETLMAMAAEKK